MMGRSLLPCHETTTALLPRLEGKAEVSGQAACRRRLGIIIDVRKSLTPSAEAAL